MYGRNSVTRGKTPHLTLDWDSKLIIHDLHHVNDTSENGLNVFCTADVLALQNA